MILIDGSKGEGGGQILRSALTLSLVTGRAFRIEGIRAGRSKPGLLRQHLTSVLAARDVGAAEVDGAALGSLTVTFRPRQTTAGKYVFQVGTAGSATLVFQTVLPALVLADGPSSLVLSGGTHNSHAPPFDFLERSYLPLLERMGPRVRVRLERPGFFPRGGGRFFAEIEPVKRLAPIVLPERAEWSRKRARAVVAGLPEHIAERELDTLAERLRWPRREMEIETLPARFGPGNVVMATIGGPHHEEVFTGFGQRGVPAERVASQVADEVQAVLASGAAVGEHLADQLLLPMALAGKGRFVTVEPSMHTRTQAEIIAEFLDVQISMEALDGGRWRIVVGSA